MNRKLLAGMLGLFLAVRLSPAASRFWARWISLPLLNGLATIGDRVPFALLEWAAGAACALLIVSLFRKRFFKTLGRLLTGLAAMCLVIWYPLYFLPQPVYSADARQIAGVCKALISKLNENDLCFPAAGDLPAKFIRFPQWMDALEITGLCAFVTGEALISPELEPISRPFVAVHERMHLRGHAGEGEANIAAWEECISRGGSYAASARIWALRYCLGVLRRSSPALYEEAMLQMNHETLQFYREAGGAYSPAPPPEFLRRLYAALGVETATQDYEILAHYLAAESA